MASKNFLEGTKIAAKIRQLRLEGLSHAAIAAAISTKTEKVSAKGIGMFLARHALEVQRTKAHVEARAESAHVGIAIANKGQRLAGYQEVYNELMVELRLRGVTYVTVRTTMADGEEVETRTARINEPLIRSIDRVLRHAAEEMGEIPRWQAPDEGKGYGKPGDIDGELAGGAQPVPIYRNVPASLGIGARPGEPGYIA